MRAGDEVALMGFAARSQLIQPLTTDTKTLGAQIIGNIYKQTLGRETLVNEALLEAAPITIRFRNPASFANPFSSSRIMREPAELSPMTRSCARCMRETLSSQPSLSGKRPPRTRPPGADGPSAALPDVRRFVRETGGQVVIGTAPAQALQPVLQGLTTRYTMQYTAPPSEDGKFGKFEWS